MDILTFLRLDYGVASLIILYFVKDGRTDPNYRKASILKSAVSQISA